MSWRCCYIFSSLNYGPLHCCQFPGETLTLPVISRVYGTLLLLAGFVIKSTSAISSALVTQHTFTDFEPPSPHIVHDIHAGEGEERGKRTRRENPRSMKGACILHIVPINSIRLPTVRNTPSLNTLARNPVIQCLRDRVPTPAFLDNPQSLTDPSFDLRINPPTPAHSGFVHELHSLSLLTTVHGFRSLWMPSNFLHNFFF